ncbi:hypothetical protein GCM10020219_029900 [Nonomuraea dietziae]
MPSTSSAGGAARLDEGDGAGQRGLVARDDGLDGRRAAQLDVALLNQLVDHSGQAEPLAVLGGEDAGDATGVQQLDLLGDDHTAAPAVHPDVSRAALAQQLDEVAEELDVPALVRADRHALHVLLDGGGDDLLDGPVVAEMDHLRPLYLQDSPHDVDRGVMAVEQRCGGHESDGMDRCVHARSLLCEGPPFRRY